MGIYLNPDNIDFQVALNSEIYVDKSELIKQTNAQINTEQRFICVSRPRRFGKSMAANMLAAYYSRGCDSKEMFSKYKISAAPSFEKHLNKYNVIHINMVNSLGESKNIEEMIQFRIENAKTLLSQTDMTVTEISRECGYSSYNYFVRQFRSSEGCSPSEYRDEQKRKAEENES